MMILESESEPFLPETMLRDCSRHGNIPGGALWDLLPGSFFTKSSINFFLD